MEPGRMENIESGIGTGTGTGTGTGDIKIGCF